MAEKRWGSRAGARSRSRLRTRDSQASAGAGRLGVDGGERGCVVRPSPLLGRRCAREMGRHAGKRPSSSRHGDRWPIESTTAETTSLDLGKCRVPSARGAGRAALQRGRPPSSCCC
ncbi:hypothetical protein MRX96_003654 [Rhipicephalus microplus]